MKSHTQHLTFNIPARMDFVNITAEEEEAVRTSGVQAAWNKARPRLSGHNRPARQGAAYWR